MNNWLAALRLTGIGFYIAICILLGTGGGLWLDDKLDTGPWLLILGLVFGLLLSIFGVYRMLRPFLNHSGDKENRS